ncbi:Uncharacterised protein [uncultured archaeon]|nr:Uncharacterised protein [uncultured archaeon]
MTFLFASGIPLESNNIAHMFIVVSTPLIVSVVQLFVGFLNPVPENEPDWGSSSTTYLFAATSIFPPVPAGAGVRAISALVTGMPFTVRVMELSL